MNQNMQIILVCKTISNDSKQVQSIKNEILQSIQHFKKSNYLSPTQNALLTKIYSPTYNQDDSSEYIIVWKSINNNIPIKSYISTQNDIKNIKNEIRKKYNIVNSNVIHIYPIPYLVSYNVMFNGQNRLGFFIRPIHKSIAYTLGTYLVNTLRQNYENQDFRLKITIYNTLENK